jgi:hypothetical protein
MAPVLARRYREMMRRLLGILLIALGPLGHGQSDVAGSRDPLGIERYPRAWIVEYQRDEEFRPREFVMGRVERLRRDVRVQELLRLDGTLEAATYRIPDGVPVDQVAAHFHNKMEGGLLFRCSGRDCGRSSEWANQIWNQATLFGPDANQHYLAWEWQGRLLAVYVIERGNRRVYAHLQVLEPADEAVLGANALLGRLLTGQGWATLDGVVPRGDGTLPPGAQTALAALHPQLAEVGAADAWLVCHLYGARPVAELLAASERCAQSAIEALGDAGGNPGLRIQPFGAGPLLPRGARSGARLELVIPQRLVGRTAD